MIRNYVKIQHRIEWWKVFYYLMRFVILLGLKNTAIILFLNKIDLFEEKIKVKDLKNYFPDYNGGLEKEPALKFIQDRFQQQNQNNSRKIYVHFTCAVDTQNIIFVFQAVRETLLTQVLGDLGIS